MQSDQDAEDLRTTVVQHAPTLDDSDDACGGTLSAPDSAYAKLVELCQRVGAQPSFALRLLVDHPSPPTEFQKLVQLLRKAANDRESLAVRALAASDAADHVAQVLSNDEALRTTGVLRRIALALHPSCAAFQRELNRLLRESDGIALASDELVVVLKPSQFATNDGRQAFLCKVAPMWREMIQLALCTADEQLLTWSTHDAEAVVKSIRCYYALVSYPSLTGDDAAVDQRDAIKPLPPFRSTYESLASFADVALPLWNRIVRLMTTSERDTCGGQWDLRKIERQQAALWRHLESHCSSTAALLLTPPKFSGLAGGIDHSGEHPDDAPGQTAERPRDDASVLALSDVPKLQVIHGPIPKSASKEDADAIKQFETLAEQAMPIALMPSRDRLQVILDTLMAEFPWATSVTEEVGRLLELRSLLGCRELMLPPLLLAGPPGTGKSRFARRLAQLLVLPFQSVGLGGSHDIKLLMGTSRGWGGGCPSPLLTHLLQDRTASALVLLDEVDKCAAYDQGSRPLSNVLLNLLEPETSSRFRDGFLLTRCDLSRLLYVATANSLAIPAPLLSRFTVLYMPEPRPQDRLALANSMLGDMADEMGVPREAMPDVPRELADMFKGNARDLRFALHRFLYDWAKGTLGRDRLH